MEANKPCNSGLGCTLTVLFMGFSNIPDNEAEVIQNHVAEIFIITDMGGLQHFQMGVVFAGAIPFNDFMPASIAKTLSVLQGEKPVLSFNSALILLGALGILPPATSAMLHNLSTLGISLRSMTDLLEQKPSL